MMVAKNVSIVLLDKGVLGIACVRGCSYRWRSPSVIYQGFRKAIEWILFVSQDHFP